MSTSLSTRPLPTLAACATPSSGETYRAGARFRRLLVDTLQRSSASVAGLETCSGKGPGQTRCQLWQQQLPAELCRRCRPHLACHGLDLALLLQHVHHIVPTGHYLHVQHQRYRLGVW